MEKKSKTAATDAATDHAAGEVVVLDDSRHGEYQRTFTPRQIHVISLGGNIGSGLLIATGKALANSMYISVYRSAFIVGIGGLCKLLKVLRYFQLAARNSADVWQGGPGAFVFCYGFVAIMVCLVLQVLSEMTIAFPVSGNFIEYADRWVDPALGFAAGFAEWLGWTVVVGSEATFFVVIVNYWAEGVVPEAALLSIFLVVIVALFMLPSRYFGYFEYGASLVKIFGLLLFLVCAIAMIAGAGPKGKAHTGETWREFPSFVNGFQGISNSWLLAIWAMGDQVFTGILGGECKLPRYSLSRAAKLVSFRVFGIYMAVIIFVSLLIPMNEPLLFGSSSTAASPFVIALNDAGIPGLPHVMNVVLLTAVTTLAAECIYIGSRVLRAMALLNYLPQYMADVDSQGRPRAGIAVTLVVGIICTYMNLSTTGATIFTWLSSITSSSYFMVWIIICITSWRFHAALKAQNDPLFRQPYAWQCAAWPYPALALFVMSMVLLVGCIYIGLKPLGSHGVSVYNFFQYVLGVLLIGASFVGYKGIFRTKFRDPRTADLLTGRRELGSEDLEVLDKYYAKPPWRRFLGYVKLW